MTKGTVIIEGQRVNLDKVVGYTKVNNKVLLFNTSGGIAQSGDDAGVYIFFNDSKKLTKSLVKLDDIFNAIDLLG